MALRDWLDPDYDPHVQVGIPGQAESSSELATLANFSKELANGEYRQQIEYKRKLKGISSFSKISDPVKLRNTGLKRLEAAAAGLPISLDELIQFFADDLQSWGTGAVRQAAIRKACEWYTYKYKGKLEHHPEPIPAGMVRCTDCQQNRCKWNSGYIRQYSPGWRWCRDYTAKIHQIADYPKR